MKLLINTSLLRFGGAVQVALSFIHECRNHPQHQYHVVVGTGVGAILKPTGFPANFYFYPKAFGEMGLAKLHRVQQEMAALERLIEPDCVLTSSGPSYWRSNSPHLMGFNLPLYIYPESPYLSAMSFAKKAKLGARRLLHSYYFRRDADAYIVQTDDVNERVRRLLKTEQVYTITNNHNAWYDRPQAFPDRLPSRRDGVFRLLTLSSYYPHKNLDLISQVIEALPESLRTRLEFVLTLTEAEYCNQISPKIPDQIQLIGPVPPHECPSLYQECDAMFLPTLAECFSASYPEAMKMEKPIITTDLGFARSICRDAALYFKPFDAISAAQAIERLVSYPNLIIKLKEAGRQRLLAFDSPARRAEKVLTICEALVRGKVIRNGEGFV